MTPCKYGIKNLVVLVGDYESLLLSRWHHYTPAPRKVKWVTLDSPWHLFIWPSVGKVAESFWKKKTIWSIHLIPCIYCYGLSFLTHIDFHDFNIQFDPLVANYFPEVEVSRILFLKTICSVHLIPYICPYEMTSLTPVHFLCFYHRFLSSGGYNLVQNIVDWWEAGPL